MTVTSTQDKKTEVAKQYVDKQLETMKKFGSAPKNLSKEQYNALISRIAAVVRV